MYCIYCSLQILHMSGDFCTVVYVNKKEIKSRVFNREDRASSSAISPQKLKLARARSSYCLK